jgi:hypothetical protein
LRAGREYERVRIREMRRNRRNDYVV